MEYSVFSLSFPRSRSGGNGLARDNNFLFASRGEVNRAGKTAREGVSHQLPQSHQGQVWNLVQDVGLHLFC